MKGKKFFIDVIILVIFAAVVFFIGWIQFTVSPGTCAIMKTKTGGLYPAPIVSGKFIWRWERLLPTNVTLENFDLSVYESAQTVSGKLPGADLYSSRLSDKNIDFSYNVTVSISMNISPEGIYSLVSENKINTNEDLPGIYDSKARLAASYIAEYLVSNPASIIKPASLNESEIKEIIDRNPDEFRYFSINSVSIENAKLPDIELYNLSKSNYIAYQELLNTKISQRVDFQAELFVEQDRMLAQLEKLGTIMQRYPQLEEMFKTGDAVQIMNAIRSVQ